MVKCWTKFKKHAIQDEKVVFFVVEVEPFIF